MNTDALTADSPLAPGFDPGETAESRTARHDAAAARFTATEADDATLMQRFQEEGDFGAFETLFARHKRGLLSFVARLAGDRTIAEDVSQHTWLKLIESARQRAYTPRPGATFQTWLFTLARNRFVDEYVRRHDVARVTTDRADFERSAERPDERASPETHVDRTQLKALLETALRELPFEQREVIALWSAGTDIETMVRLTGAPRDTVLSRKKYAIARLRRLLEARGVGPEVP